MTLILKSPQCLSQIDKKFISLFSPATQEILNNFQNQKNLSQENSDSLNYLYLKSEVEEIEEKEIVPEIQFCLKEVQSLEIKSKLNEISREIKKAEEDKNPEKVKKLTQEFFQLSKEII